MVSSILSISRRASSMDLAGAAVWDGTVHVSLMIAGLPRLARAKRNPE